MLKSVSQKPNRETSSSITSIDGECEGKPVVRTALVGDVVNGMIYVSVIAGEMRWIFLDGR